METVLSDIMSNLGLLQPQSAAKQLDQPATTTPTPTPPNVSVPSVSEMLTPPNSSTTSHSSSNGFISPALLPAANSFAANNGLLLNFGQKPSQHEQQMKASPVSTDGRQHQTPPSMSQHQQQHQQQQNSANAQQPQQHHHQQQQRTSRTYFRPPGLGPGGNDPNEYPPNALVCPECGFSCNSKFHYNSHMNTHKTQQCPMCTYQARTEGRLRKHIQESHTHEQRVAAGITISPRQGSTGTAHSTAAQNSPKREEKPTLGKCGGGGDNSIPTSIAPLLNSMLGISDHSAQNGAMPAFAQESLYSILNNNGSGNPLAQFSNPTDFLKICTDAIANNGAHEKAYNSPQKMGDLGTTALEHLRAFTERQAANFLATSTANALGGIVGADLHAGQEGSLLVGGGQPENGGGGMDAKQDTPRRAGKPKRYKCKQCEHVSHSKDEQWAHSKGHIPKQKQLTCELCDFVTEYKHHLEYHYRNHNGQKPFKCGTCAYTCVNKSMLNSHMKSHTPVYQFRCQDCTYQTKYCHSLKMHLRKYNHKRAPGAGGSESSGESHGDGEERQENASSSSVGKDDSFENGMLAQEGNVQDSHMADSNDVEMAMEEKQPSQQGQQNAGAIVAGAHSLLMAAAAAQQHQQMAADMEVEQQRLIIQQQLEQMNELIRPPAFDCPHCPFSSSNIDEINQHLLIHLIANQQQPQHAPAAPPPPPPSLIADQAALASMYQRIVAQLQHEFASNGNNSSPFLAHPDPSATAALLGHGTTTLQQQPQNEGQEMPMDLEKACQMERDAAESIRQQQEGGIAGAEHPSAMGKFPQRTHASTAPPPPPPVSTSVASLLNQLAGHAHADRVISSSSALEPCRPSSSLLLQSCSSGGGNVTPGMGPLSAKEFQKQPQQQQLPFAVPLQLQQSDEATANRRRSTLSGHEAQQQVDRTCLVKNVISGGPSNLAGTTDIRHVVGNFDQQHPPQTSCNNAVAGTAGGAFGPNLLNHYANMQAHANNLPFHCQHCDIAFKDYVLYQLHRGYHSIETPLKCNRCGLLSATPLDFNLHLYQAKHE